MQLASAEESCNNSHDVSLLPSCMKSEVKSASVATHFINEATLVNSLSCNSVAPKAEHHARLPSIPSPGTHFESYNNPLAFPQSAQFQNSARALKDELQQGVEDVCQKLNNFFGNSKPTPLSSSSKQVGFTQVKTPDRSSFSLFNNK